MLTDIEMESYKNCSKILEYMLMTPEEYDSALGEVLYPENVVKDFNILIKIVEKNEPTKFDLFIIRGLTVVITSNKYINMVKDAAILLLKAYKDREIEPRSQ